MASGSVIQYSNFPTGEASTFGTTKYEGTNSIYLYCSAPAIQIRVMASGAFVTTASFTLRCSYYNWNTGSWVEAGTITGSARGRETYDIQNFYHNYGGSNTYSGSENFHLWEFYIYCTSGTGGISGNYVSGWAGGCGKMSSSQYSSICQNKLIVSAGNLGGDFFYNPSGYDRSTALSLFRWSNNTGSPIAWGSGTYLTADKLIPKSWV